MIVGLLLIVMVLLPLPLPFPAVSVGAVFTADIVGAVLTASAAALCAAKMFLVSSAVYTTFLGCPVMSSGPFSPAIKASSVLSVPFACPGMLTLLLLLLLAADFAPEILSISPEI